MKFAIIGAGVMGRGWMTQFAMNEGNEVHAFDVKRKAREGTFPFCEKLAEKCGRRQKVEDPAAFARETLARITVHDTMEAFVKAAYGCKVLLEAIFEDMELKCGVLGKLLPQLPKDLIFWSNTSSLDIDVMSEAGGRPENSIVTHGMNPVPMMPGVEVVPGAKTSSETVDFTRVALEEMGKRPFLAPNIPGFWVNRLLVPQMLDAVRLLEQDKIRVEDGDVGLNTSLGHPQGTFKLHDFVTAPTMLRVAWEMYQATCDPRMYPPLLLMRMVHAGEHGANTGKGFYDWSGSGKPVPRDLSHLAVPDVDAMLDVLK